MFLLRQRSDDDMHRFILSMVEHNVIVHHLMSRANYGHELTIDDGTPTNAFSLEQVWCGVSCVVVWCVVSFAR